MITLLLREPMKNPLDQNKTNLLLPVLIGAAAAAALAYFLISEDTASLRDELAEKLSEGWDTFTDRAMEKISGLKSTAQAATKEVA
jgi:hypothetical protein